MRKGFCSNCTKPMPANDEAIYLLFSGEKDLDNVAQYV